MVQDKCNYGNIIPKREEYVLLLDQDHNIIWIDDQGKIDLNLDYNCEFPIHTSSLEDWHYFLNKTKSQYFASTTVLINMPYGNIKRLNIFGYYNQSYLTYRLVIKLQPNLDQVLFSPTFTKPLSLFDHLNLGVVITRTNGEILKINTIARQILNLYSENLSIKEMSSIFETDENIFYIANQLKNKKSVSCKIKSKYNNQYYLLNVKYDVHLDCFIVILDNISEKVELSKQLSEKKYVNDIGEMTATLVHEIRNPIAAMKGIIDLISASENNNNKHYLSVMESEIERLDKLLGNILVLAKPKAEMHIFNVKARMKTVVDLMAIEAEKHNITIKEEYCSNDIYILGNEICFTQILVNLIKNAIQAIDKNGLILIKLQMNEQNEIQLNVIDNGVGISEEEIGEIFTLYYSTKEEGTGLGLPLVKKYVEEMKGKIRVNSSLKKGTDFELTFPQIKGNKNLLGVNHASI